MTQTFPSTCIGMACWFRRKWMEWPKTARPRSHLTAGGAINSSPGRRGPRWYHSHTAAMMDLQRGAYTGQFGFLMIDSSNDPGRYDQEVFLALREWQSYLTTTDQDEGPVKRARRAHFRSLHGVRLIPR